MDISFSIVTWNSIKTITRCIESILGGLPSLLYEVHVIDNDSSDGTADHVAVKFPWVKLTRLPKNVGYSAANNLALMQMSGRHAVIMNPDIRLHRNFERTVKFLDDNPSVVAVTPKILNPDLTLQIVNARRFPTILSESIKFWNLDTLFPSSRLLNSYSRPIEVFDVPQEIEVMQGSCMVCKISALKEVGFMDERYFMYAEDYDLCMELHKTGGKLFHYPFAEVVHGHESRKGSYPGGVSTTQVTGTWLHVEGFRSKYKYFAKQRGRRYAQAYRLVLFCLEIIGTTVTVLKSFLRNGSIGDEKAVLQRNADVIKWCVSVQD